MRTVTVENNKIVVEVDGAKVRYDLRIVQKRITSLLQDLEEWRKYERLLTPDAADLGYCVCKVKFTEKNEAGEWICNKCHRPSR